MAGLIVIETSTGGVTVNDAVAELDPKVAVIVAIVWLPTALVVAVNFPVVDFAATDTVLGTTTDDELEVSLMTVAALG